MNAAEQGHLLLKQGQAKEAEVAFRRVLEGEPDHVEALNVVGLAALRDGDIDRRADAAQACRSGRRRPGR